MNYWHKKDKDGRELHECVAAGLFGMDRGDLLSRDFHDAARRGDADTVRHLIENGVNVNDRDQFGRSALDTAIIYNTIDVVRVLVKKGIDVNAKGKRGETPLHECSTMRRAEIEELLKRAGATLTGIAAVKKPWWKFWSK